MIFHSRLDKQVTPAGDHLPERKGPRDFRFFRAWLTLLACVACILIFILFASQPDRVREEAFGFLVPNIWQGGYWGVVTSAFVHFEIWHLGFNIYWLWHLGSLLEERIGSLRWVALFVSSAIVSSSFELAAAGSTGIGMSGVVYALFGFMWMTRDKYPEFGKILTPKTSFIFLIWLVLCFVMTYTGAWHIANAAHLAGLVFGITIAAAFSLGKHRALSLAGMGLMIAGAIISLFWAPWSMTWTATQGEKAYTRGDYAAAIRWYKTSQRLGQDARFVWFNLTYAYHQAGRKEECRQALEHLREIDPDAAAKLDQYVQEHQ